MAEFSPDVAFEQLRAVLEENNPNADLTRIRQAFDFAVQVHPHILGDRVQTHTRPTFPARAPCGLPPVRSTHASI